MPSEKQIMDARAAARHALSSIERMAANETDERVREAADRTIATIRGQKEMPNDHSIFGTDDHLRP